MKLDIPAIPFTRAWEAVISTSGNDKDRLVTFRSVSVEVFEDQGLRLVSSDGYLSAWAWVPLEESTESKPEPGLDVAPDEQFIVLDADYRGLGLLKHARKQLKASWQLKAKDEDPDTTPTLRIETRSPHRSQTVLEGLDLPLFYIDFPDHELVALSVMQSDFVNWRSLAAGLNAKPAAIDGLNLGTDQITHIAKVAKLYPTFPVVLSFFNETDVVGMQIGPVKGVLRTADADLQPASSLDEDDLDFDDD